jgi:uncharacterized protein
MKSIAAWRNQKHIHTLTGCECVACKQKYYPKKYLCVCGAQQFVEYTFCGRGTLITFTKTASTILGIIALDEGVRVLAEIVDTDYETLTIGMSVHAVFRKLYEDGDAGCIVYGMKFSSYETTDQNKAS